MNARAIGAVVITATAVVAVVLTLAPVAESGSSPGLKMTTTNSDLVTLSATSRKTITATCPRGYHATGIGQSVDLNLSVVQSEKRSARTVSLTLENTGATSGQAAVQALCAKGTGGFGIADNSTAFRF